MKKTETNTPTPATKRRRTTTKTKSNGTATAKANVTQANGKVPAVPVEEPKVEKIEAPDFIRKNFKIFNEYFDAGYAYSMTRRLLHYINKYYFRIEYIGFDKEDYPERNNPDHPLIFASNHSGMAFPWDAICFSSGLLEKFDYDISKVVRPITAPALSKAHFMSPFMIKNFWRRLGGIDATRLNFETMMYYPDAHVLIYPEGVPGIGKGFDNRYHLQRMSTSSLRLSIKYKTDIIPFATINGEYINPLSYSLSVLNDLVQKIGIPFIPLGPMTLLIPFQPWLFYFALPAKLKFVRGRRIKPYEMIDKPYDELTEEEIYDLRDRVQGQMQRELDQAVAFYGEDPYELGELFEVIKANVTKLFHFIPTVWPVLFIEHERQYRRLKEIVFGSTDKSHDSPQEQIELIRHAHELEGEEEVTLGSVIGTLFRNPEILLLYTPVVGLVSMFTSTPDDK